MMRILKVLVCLIISVWMLNLHVLIAAQDYDVTGTNEIGANVTIGGGLEIADQKKPRNVYFDEELPVELKVKITTAAARLEVQTINYFKQTVCTDTVVIDGTTEVNAKLLTDVSYGYFVSGFSLLNQFNEVISYKEIPFCVIRKPKKWGEFDPESKFGFHGSGNNPTEMEVMERMGMKWNRSYHWWRFDQPNKQGPISTSRLQSLYNFDRKYHMNMIMCIRPETRPNGP